MPPERYLLDGLPGETPSHETVQQIIEAESGKGTQGIRRAWQASDSARVVLTSDAAGVKISRDNGVTAPAQVIVDGTAAGGQLSGTYPNPGLSTAALDLLCPPGTIVAYGGVAAPAGWVACDGAAYANAAYPRLQAVLGYAYGGNGTTVFAVPDLRGRFPLGASGPHPRASVGGSDSPAHTHPQTHNHGMNSHTHGPGLHTHLPGAHVHSGAGHTHTPGVHTHGMQTHTHVVDVDHDHANALAAAGVSATATNAILNGTGASTTVPASNHTHPVDIPSLTTTLKTSQGAVTSGAASGPSANDTGGASAANTGGPSLDATTTPVAATPTDAATGSTANDSTAGAGAWATDGLPPFQAVAYIIRTG